MRLGKWLRVGIIGLVVGACGTGGALAQKAVLERAGFGSYLALWRVTHDAVVDDHANYHQHQCWSHDGRYLSYRHCPMVANPEIQAEMPYAGYSVPTVHVFDFFKNEDRDLGLGIQMLPGASWANQHNWLFHVQLKEADRGFAPNDGAPVIWTDLDTGRSTMVGDRIDQLGGVSHDDQWLYGGIKDPSQNPQFRTARIRIGSSKDVEELKDVVGFQWVVNPRQPLFFTRHNNPNEPFGSTVSFWDLDGTKRRMGMLVLEAAHMAWLGNGEYFLIGDGLPRGRRWDEPAPSNVHVLAAGNVGNLSVCGTSGRFAVGDSALFDLRSGDSWQWRYFLSPELRKTKDFYPSFDGESKGSPDATKIAFTVRYDMEKGPVTELTQTLRPGDQPVQVKSTEGFPESGAIVIWTEVIGYTRKTATTFEGLTRILHGTRSVDGTPAGRAVTEFTHHLLTDAQWKEVKAVGNELRQGLVDDLNSPLLRQRTRDVYVAAVRRPDRPWLQVTGNIVELVPGEAHDETAGYHLHLNGKRVTTRLVRAGESFPMKQAGEYAAVAVEWSGLESELGNVVRLTPGVTMKVLAEAPAAFNWTREQWLIDAREVSPDQGMKATEAVREALHRFDGAIARGRYVKGVIAEHHDLNAEGKAIRRLTYEGGKLTKREYFNRDDQRVSSQLFAPDGFITETIGLGNNGGREVETDHWWFEKGTPVRRMSGGVEYVKDGEVWKIAK